MGSQTQVSKICPPEPKDIQSLLYEYVVKYLKKSKRCENCRYRVEMKNLGV